MYRIPVPLPGMLRIYISDKVSYRLSEQRSAYLPTSDRLVTDLCKLGSQGGIPAILYQRQGKPLPELQLYTDRHYYAVLYLMEQHMQGYALGHIEPLGLREQERMSKGVLLLQAPSWSWCADPRALQGCQSFWFPITRAWGSLQTSRKQARATAHANTEQVLTPGQENYLNSIRTLVDLEHRLEQDRHQFPQQISYYSVEATGEQRYARDIYTFRLHGSPALNEKHLLRIVEERGLQARVLAYRGDRLTLKFERAVDLDRIPPAGTLEPMVSGAIDRTRREALETLREGEAKNPHLLRVLVDHQFLRASPGTQTPAQPLNPRQLEAFQRALTIPDLLLVWGPPGTGKSRTITEIARAYSAQGRRVLITAGTHKAVDNVLEQFLSDKHLMVVRFGHEDRILETVRARLTIDEQTRAMKQQVLQRTHELAAQLQTFTQTTGLLHTRRAQAQTLLSHWHDLQQRQREVQQQLSDAGRQIDGQYRPRLQALDGAARQFAAKIERQTQRLTRMRQQHQRVLQKVSPGFPGVLYRWWSHLLHSRLARRCARLAELQRLAAGTSQNYHALQLQLQEALNAHPTYRQHAGTLALVRAQSARCLYEVQECVQELPPQTRALLPPPPATATGDDLQRYFSQLPARAAVLEKRAALLHSWRNELETSAEQLTPEVLRYADIVGATCIGVATARGLADDIDFDVVIADEAGQISTPDLLVPLVRARRAILVGDHMQLPPYVDRSVQTWLTNLSPQALQELNVQDEIEESSQLLDALTHSAFEQLLRARPGPEHLVVLTEQRRMPAVIAGFASHHFYRGHLTTVHTETGACDPLFRSALAFVDTSALPAARRREFRRERTEEWGNPGFTNQCEARLIARLAARYEQQDVAWGIIVPYRAQAEYLIALMKPLIEVPDFRWEERIATVDSFQGSERSTIIYGFTRSNSDGRVGFLSELRRLNVALTRATQQLVLIGDLSTLTRASDPHFCTLMQSLCQYLQEHGEVLSYEECQRRSG